MARPGYFPITVLTLSWFARTHHIPASHAAELVMIVWLVVFAHELGHGVVTELLGGEVHGMIVTPFMGVTWHSLLSDRHLGLMTIAGPLAGAAAGAVGLCFVNDMVSSYAQSVAMRAVLWAGIADNLVFNLLPFGTLDGGYLALAIKQELAKRTRRSRREDAMELA